METGKNFALKQNKNPYLIVGSQITGVWGGAAVTSANINLAYQKNKAARGRKKNCCGIQKPRPQKKSHSLFFKYGIKIGAGGWQR